MKRAEAREEAAGRQGRAEQRAKLAELVRAVSPEAAAVLERDTSAPELVEVEPVTAPARPPKRERLEAKAAEGKPADPRHKLASLTRNPRALAYWMKRARATHAAIARANRAADKRKLGWLDVPHHAYDLCHSICDQNDAAAGALEWIRKSCGPAVALEVEAAALFRVPGGKQIDDWSCARARRKLAEIVFFLMSPWLMPRTLVCGSRNGEDVTVTAGVPQTCLVGLFRSGVREPFTVRTLQRDLQEIEWCTALLERRRAPIAKAESWEKRGQSQGVVNRYCVRAGLIRSIHSRASDAAEALIKQVRLQMASWMVFREPPRRGEQVPIVGQLAPP